MIQTEQTYKNAAIGEKEDVLQSIHSSSKNIAIYQRNIASLGDELNQIAENTIECRASGTVEEVQSALQGYFHTNLPGCSSLLEDIMDQVKLFEQITHASSFRLLLTTVSTNMCRKFHTDVNDLRLICTYMGPGTLWVPDEAIDYKALKARGEEQDIIKDEQKIQQVQTGDIVLLKGALYPEANPILHRSPAIEEQGERRLLLRLDTNKFLNFLA